MHNGLSHNKSKRSWRICPRCKQEAIAKDLRKCTVCSGRVYFRTGNDCDAFEKSIEIREGFFCWDKPVVCNLEGWYSQDFYGVSYSLKR